jgi:hypothetical protein
MLPTLRQLQYLELLADRPSRLMVVACRAGSSRAAECRLLAQALRGEEA